MKKLIVGITVPASVGLLEGQLKYFKECGYDTYLMAPKDERTLHYCEREGCRLLEINISRQISVLNDLKTLSQIISILRKVKPDVVNFGTPKISLLGLLAARFTGVERRIFTCRGFRFEHEQGFIKWLLKRLDRIAALCAHKIICISPSVMELGIHEHIFSAEKCQVINKGSSNGLNLTKFRRELIPVEAKSELMKMLAITENNFVFGFVGRINDRKGVNELFAAFCHLYSKNTDFRLLIVGPFESDQVKDKDLYENLCCHPGVILPGRTDEVPLYLTLMHIFVLPTWSEGFGNVLVQAAAMGIPVISTFATGARDAVSNGNNGVLVPVKDTVALIRVMDELSHDDHRRVTLGRNGIEWAKNFDREIIWGGMEKLYNS